VFFDHWKVVTGDPFETDSKAFEIVALTRKRKGLPQEVPPLDRFLDKM